MTFATMRQTVLQRGTLAFYGELVDITRRSGVAQSVTAKITHRQSGPRADGSRQSGPQRQNTVDELEQVEALFSRDPTYVDSAGACLALLTKPEPGDKLQRALARDADRRPFQFAGEVVFEGDQHAVYVFQRPRRFVAGGGR